MNTDDSYHSGFRVCQETVRVRHSGPPPINLAERSGHTCDTSDEDPRPAKRRKPRSARAAFGFGSSYVGFAVWTLESGGEGTRQKATSNEKRK